MEEADLIKALEAYAEGRLDARTAEQLERQLRDRPELRATYQATRRTLDEMTKAELRAELADIARHPVARSRSTTRRRFLAMAAAILLVLSAGWYVWQLPSDIDRQHYTAYYTDALTVHPELASIRGEAPDGVQTVWNAALQAYVQENYALARQQLLRIPETETNRFHLDYLLADVYFNENNPERAVPLLTELINTKNVHTESAEWLLVLTYLQQQNESAARRLLTDIAQREPSHVFRARATDLLADLD